MAKLKIASWNINSVRARIDIVKQFLEEQQVDVLCLQETKVRDDTFPFGMFRDLGYDRDFDSVVAAPPGPDRPTRPAPGWWRVLFDHPARRVVLPRGVMLDLGATAKAFASDRAARDLSRTLDCGVLVSLGGDISVAGETPPGGWRVGIGDDHRIAAEHPDVSIAINSGGLATSSTTCRTWRRGDRRVHHIVDPRTGDVPNAVWRTVTVAAGNCVDANTASTAAIVLGEDAPDWLAARGLPARLVGVSGTVLPLSAWPADELAGVA